MGSLEIPTLLTERLRLRSFRRDDLDDYAALNADPDVLRFLGGGAEPWDRCRSWRHMAFLLGHWQLAGSGMWALEHRGSGAFIHPENRASIRVAVRLGERLQGRIHHFGREMLCYGIERQCCAAGFRQEALVRRPGKTMETPSGR